ncbi:MAG: acylphosphatase [Candidatus Paceibacterota bacterium]
MKEVDITIYGKVQGVGFRAYTQRTAEKLDITGYVQNMSEGHVEIIAQGEEEKLKELIEKIKSGSSFASVDDIDIRWHDRPQDTLTDFEIQ